MKNLIDNGIEGVFIPLEEFNKGKFFSEEELLNLQQTIVDHRKSIVELQKELKK
jgi:hypothetical protein